MASDKKFIISFAFLLVTFQNIQASDNETLPEIEPFDVQMAKKMIQNVVEADRRARGIVSPSPVPSLEPEDNPTMHKAQNPWRSKGKR